MRRAPLQERSRGASVSSKKRMAAHSARRNQRNARSSPSETAARHQEREITGWAAHNRLRLMSVLSPHRTAEAEVKNGEFREDLFFRLNVIEIKLPSLRERPQDIPVLTNFFAEKYAEANGVASAIGTQIWTFYVVTLGAEMFVNWRTPCIAPFCWRKAMRSARAVF